MFNCLLLHVSGYVILPGASKFSSEPPFGIRWDAARNNSFNTGVTGGLAFAYSPSFDSFCKALIKKMQENTAMFTWTDCEQIQNAVMRAMATWEANHQVIKFVDVSQACEREALSDSRILQDMRYCTQAEVVISAGQPDSDVSTVAALVRQYNTLWDNPSDRSPLSTGGSRATKDFTIQKATMHFHNHICWYLDNTFCGNLHNTYALGFDVEILLAVISFGLWSIGLFVFMRQLVGVFKRILQHVAKSTSFRDAAEDVLIQVTDALSRNKAMLLLLIICPVVYFDVIMPCFACYDFEAAAAHELGHVLGFGHPDQYFLDNMRRPAEVVTDRSTCRNVELPGFGHNRVTQLVGVSALTTDFVDDCSVENTAGKSVVCANSICCATAAFNRVPLTSIMYSLTTHTARPCLDQDDLDGLNHLYPSCEFARLTEPVCIKSERNLGYIRFALNVLIPFLLTAFSSQLLFTWSFRHHKRKEIKGRWKLGGRFVAVDDAAALCVQAQFRKHSVMIQRYRQDVSAILVQSAFRGALERKKLEQKHRNSFGSIAMALRADINLQRGLHEASKVTLAEEKLQTMRTSYGDNATAEMV